MTDPQDQHQRRYPTLTPPSKDALEALIWLSQQPQAAPIMAWLLSCSADKDNVCRNAEGTPLYRAQGAQQVLLDTLEYFSSPAEYKKMLDASNHAQASAGSRFMRNPMSNGRKLNWT